jgi:hypothetical protein
VVVGHDVAVGRDHETGPQGLGPAGFAVAGGVAILKLAEKLLEG